LLNIDAFLDIHKNPRVRSFRNKVYELSRRKATPREISREIHKANHELQELEMNSWNMVISLIGIGETLYSMLRGDFVTGLFGTTTTLVAIGEEIRKAMLTQRYEWLEMVKGLCEISLRQVSPERSGAADHDGAGNDSHIYGVLGALVMPLPRKEDILITVLDQN